MVIILNNIHRIIYLNLFYYDIKLILKVLKKILLYICIIILLKIFTKEEESIHPLLLNFDFHLFF